MTYPMLQEAPKDHYSKEFVNFLRNKNVVVWENTNWLIIENCKYHTPERKWWTAFFIHPELRIPEREHLGSLVYYMPYDMALMVKDTSKRSVARWHAHIFEV